MNNFSIDETATIKSILEALKVEGVKTSDIAKEIDGISEKPLRKALKEAGYEFRNKAPKGWYFIGEGEEPLYNSIFDYVERNSHAIHNDFTQSNTSMNKDEVNFTSSSVEVTATTSEISPNSHVIHSQFTQNETRMILEMLHEWQQSKIKKPNNEVSLPIHERIKRLPTDEKSRKTVIVRKSIGERLDKYCEDEKVNKSDIFDIALLDFLDKYQK